MQLINVFNININGNNEMGCNARELHEFLNVKRDFATWIKSKIKKYGFEENIDYQVFTQTGENPILGGRPSLEYNITVDMAKELAMVENNENGRKVRRYFIEMEKQAINAVKALLTIDEQIKELTAKKNELKSTLSWAGRTLNVGGKQVMPVIKSQIAKAEAERQPFLPFLGFV